MTRLTITIKAETDDEALRVLNKMAAEMDCGSCNGFAVICESGTGIADLSHIPEHSSTQPTGHAPGEGVTP